MNNLRKIILVLLLLVILCILTPELFALLSYPEIKAQSGAEIENFVGTLDQNCSSYEKIEKIMDFVVLDYYQTYGKEPTFHLDPLWIRFPVYGDLTKNRSVKPHIRPLSLLFCEDPYLIAYYKTGACGALAVLFNKTATEAGYNSRIVGTQAEDHVWNEVYLDNQWVHVDPTLYYHSSKGDLRFENLWFNHPSAYSELNWYGGYSKILVKDAKEDISSRYLCLSNISVNFLEPADRIKVKPIGGKGPYSLEDTVDNTTYAFSIGSKDYSITAEKDVIPYLLIKEDICNFTAVKNSTLQLELSPKNVKPTMLLMSIFSVFILVILGVEVYCLGVTIWNKRSKIENKYLTISLFIITKLKDLLVRN